MTMFRDILNSFLCYEPTVLHTFGKTKRSWTVYLFFRWRMRIVSWKPPGFAVIRP